MAKGLFRIISGSILMLLQVFSLLGLKDGSIFALSFSSFDAFLFTFTSLIGFFLPGIIGFFLFKYGVKAYQTMDRAEIILHKSTSIAHIITKYVSLAFVIIRGIYIVRSFLSIDKYTSLTYILSSIFIAISIISIIVYLIFYYGKRPCFLFSTTLLFLGIHHSLHTFNSFEYFFMDAKILEILFDSLPYASAGILYMIIAVKLYKENYSTKTIRILGAIAFASEMSGTIYSAILHFQYVNLIYILETLILHTLYLFVFVYTVIIPVRDSFESPEPERIVKKAKHKKPFSKSVLISMVLSVVAIISVILAMIFQSPNRKIYEDINPSIIYIVLIVVFTIYLLSLLILKYHNHSNIHYFIAPIPSFISIFALIEGSIFSTSYLHRDPAMGFKTYVRDYYSDNELILTFNITIIIISFAILIINMPLFISYFKPSFKKLTSQQHSSIAYKEKCYQKVERMQEFLEKGIITQEEFEENKKQILKKIK